MSDITSASLRALGICPEHPGQFMAELLPFLAADPGISPATVRHQTAPGAGHARAMAQGLSSLR